MMKYVALALLALLILLQQDYWQWENRTLVFGFLPYSIAYHAGICLAAAGLGWMVTRFCWPQGLDDATAADRSPEISRATEQDDEPQSEEPS